MQGQKSFGAQLLLLPFQDLVLLSVAHPLLRRAIVLPHWHVLMSSVELGTSSLPFVIISSTLPFLNLPFEEAIAGAFWCLSTFLGIGKREG